MAMNDFGRSKLSLLIASPSLLLIWVSFSLATQLSGAFQPAVPASATWSKSALAAARRRTLVKDFDPMGFAKAYENNKEEEATSSAYDFRRETDLKTNNQAYSQVVKEASALSLASAATALVAWPKEASAASVELAPLDPATFQPVCPSADSFYRVLRSTAESVVGAESAQEYGPLISGGLLRVRLELCVVESFFNEAVGPFIEKNGFSWVLPIHETVETFIAGTVFAVAATFILIGSTKILTVIITYTDFLFGIPSRLFGGFFYDRALGKPVTLDLGFGPFKTRVIGPPDEEQEPVDLGQRGPINLAIIGFSGVIKLFGLFLEVLREIFDAIDLFVGRYLVVWATGYVLIKFLHFKVFPDFPDFV